MTRIDHEKEVKKQLIIKRWRASLGLHGGEGAKVSHGHVTRLIEPDELLKTSSEISKLEKELSAVIALDPFIAYQKIAVSMLVKLAKDGDITLVRRMIEQFPAALRKNSMLRFLEVHGHVRVITEQDKMRVPAWKNHEVGAIIYDKLKKLKLGEALCTPWQKMS